MTSLARLVLTFIAACVAALAVIDPTGLPQWVQIAAAVLATGFAAVGIIPPQIPGRLPVPPSGDTTDVP
jgi:hypothetical protein